MKKTVILYTLLMISLIMFGCSNRPSDEELSDQGYLLSDAMNEFNDLTDNYSYQLDRHQTNGTDSFDYKLVKIYQGDIYAQMGYYHTDQGWKNKETILTYYTDLTDIPYDIYSMHNDGSSRHFYKFKYDNADESFEKLYQDLSTEETPSFTYDYRIFTSDMFDYETDNLDILNEWRINEDQLLDSTFKQKLSESFQLGLEGDAYRLNYLYLYVNDSLVTEIKYGYSYSYENINFSYTVSILIERENYQFDLGSLTSGFQVYEPLI